MIYEVWSDRPTFKHLRFRPGLNIVVARRSKSASEGDKRNAVGKSSLLEIIHFILGGTREESSPLSSPVLDDDLFLLTLDIAGEKTTVSRGFSDPKRVQITSKYLDWPVQPDVDAQSGSVSMSIPSWKDLLGQVFFGFPPDSRIPQGAFLSFRSCLSYFIRRQRAQGYVHWARNFGKQRPVDSQVNLAFLLGLDHEAPLLLHKAKEAEEAKKSLSKALKTGLLGLAIGSVAKLRTAQRRLKKSTEKLEEELSGFRVISSYAEMERQADTAQREIDILSNQNVLDGELVSDLEAAIADEKPPALPDLKRVYEEAGVVLPEVALARYPDVVRFHEGLVKNRKMHLAAEIADARKRIKKRNSKRVKLSNERNRLLEVLNSGGR